LNSYDGTKSATVIRVYVTLDPFTLDSTTLTCVKLFISVIYPPLLLMKFLRLIYQVISVIAVKSIVEKSRK